LVLVTILPGTNEDAHDNKDNDDDEINTTVRSSLFLKQKITIGGDEYGIVSAKTFTTTSALSVYSCAFI
jgi:hypothetical protein